ncbi:MAG: hypothetical protein EA381_11260 [Planctomycetaceae bacterium]|nr:MAG: hypothetical protein EA381_11260 [Planctomycetaceae bacterium]
MPQAHQILDDQFLQVRAKLIEVAAVLDRIDRVAATELTTADLESHPKRVALEQAIGLLLQDAAPGGRAEALQKLFSRPYDQRWRDSLSV